MIFIDFSSLDAKQKAALAALEGTIKEKVEGRERKQFVIFGTRFETGLNTLKSQERPASIIQVGVPRADALAQLAGRGREALDQAIYHRSKLASFDVVVDIASDKRLKLSELRRFKETFQITDSAEKSAAQRQLFDEISNQMQREVNDMNLVALVQTSEGVRGTAAARLGLLERLAGEDPVYHVTERLGDLEGLPIFLQVKTLEELRKLLLGSAKTDEERHYVEMLLLAVSQISGFTDSEGRFKKEAYPFLSKFDLIVDTHTLQDLLEEVALHGGLSPFTVAAPNGGMTSFPVHLRLSRSEVESGRSKPRVRDHLLDYVKVAFDRYQKGVGVLDWYGSEQALLYALQSSLNEAGSDVELLTVEDVRQFMRRGQSPPIASSSRAFAALYLKTLRTLRSRSANPYEKKALTARMRAIRDLLSDIERNPPISHHDLLRRVGATEAVYRQRQTEEGEIPSVTARELLTALYPFMTLGQHLYHVYHLDDKLNVLAHVESLDLEDPSRRQALEEVLRVRLPGLAVSEIIRILRQQNLKGPLTLIKFGSEEGVQVGIFTDVNVAPIVVNSTRRGVSIQFGHGQLDFVLNDGNELVPVGDHVSAPMTVGEAVAANPALQGKLKDEHGNDLPEKEAVIRVERDQDIFYLRPNSTEILFHQGASDASLKALEKLYNDHVLEDKRIKLSERENVRADTIYQNGRPDLATVYATDGSGRQTRLFSVKFQHKLIRDLDRTMRERFIHAGAKEDQMVMVARFIGQDGTQLSAEIVNLKRGAEEAKELMREARRRGIDLSEVELDRLPEKTRVGFEIPVLLQPGMRYTPASLLVAIMAEMNKFMQEFQIPFRPVVMNFDDRHSLMERNSAPTFEVEAAEDGGVPFFNIHPVYLVRAHRFSGNDPVFYHTVNGEERAIRLNESKRYRGFIHEGIGHVYQDGDTRYTIQTDEMIAEYRSGGIGHMVFDPQNGHYVEVEEVMARDPEAIVYDPQRRLFVKAKEVRRAPRGEKPGGFAAVNQAISLFRFLVESAMDTYHEERILEAVEEFVYQSEHDHAILLDNDEFYEEVKQLVLKFSKAYFDAKEALSEGSGRRGVLNTIGSGGQPSPPPALGDFFGIPALFVPHTVPDLLQLRDARTDEFIALVEREGERYRILKASSEFFKSQRSADMAVTVDANGILSRESAGSARLIRDQVFGKVRWLETQLDKLRKQSDKVKAQFNEATRPLAADIEQEIEETETALAKASGTRQKVVSSLRRAKTVFYVPGIGGEDEDGALVMEHTKAYHILTAEGELVAIPNSLKGGRFRLLTQDHNTLVFANQDEVRRIFWDGEVERLPLKDYQDLTEAQRSALAGRGVVPVTNEQGRHLELGQFPKDRSYVLFRIGNSDIVHVVFRTKEERAKIFGQFEALLDKAKYRGRPMTLVELKAALREEGGEFFPGSAYDTDELISVYNAYLRDGRKGVELTQEAQDFIRTLGNIGVLRQGDDGPEAPKKVAITNFRYDLPRKDLKWYYDHETIHGVQKTNKELMEKLLDYVAQLPPSLQKRIIAYLRYKGYAIVDNPGLIAREAHSYFRDAKVLNEINSLVRRLAASPEIAQKDKKAREFLEAFGRIRRDGTVILSPDAVRDLKQLRNAFLEMERPYVEKTLHAFPRLPVAADGGRVLTQPGVPSRTVLPEQEPQAVPAGVYLPPAEGPAVLPKTLPGVAKTGAARDGGAEQFDPVVERAAASIFERLKQAFDPKALNAYVKGPQGGSQGNSVEYRILDQAGASADDLRIQKTVIKKKLDNLIQAEFWTSAPDGGLGIFVPQAEKFDAIPLLPATRPMAPLGVLGPLSEASENEGEPIRLAMALPVEPPVKSNGVKTNGVKHDLDLRGEASFSTREEFQQEIMAKVLSHATFLHLGMPALMDALDLDETALGLLSRNRQVIDLLGESFHPSQAKYVTAEELVKLHTLLSLYLEKRNEKMEPLEPPFVVESERELAALQRALAGIQLPEIAAEDPLQVMEAIRQAVLADGGRRQL